MRGNSLIAAAAVAAMLVFGAFAPSASGELTQFDLTLTPQYITIGGVDYPVGIYDGFNDVTGPLAPPQFSKITATIIIDFNGEGEYHKHGTTVRLHHVEDPLNEFFTTIAPDPDMFIGFIPAGWGHTSPNDHLRMVFRGPDTHLGPGYFQADLYLPPGFEGEGSAIMPDSRIIYFPYALNGYAEYLLHSVVATVPEPAGPVGAVVMLASSLLRRRGLGTRQMAQPCSGAAQRPVSAA